MESRRILVTGASGFIGRALCVALRGQGHYVRGAVRKTASPRSGDNLDTVVVGNIGPDTRWDRALENIDTVVHLAARAHVLKESSRDPMSEFSRVNTQGTEQLARAAAAMGVKRFLYMSTIGVNGSHTETKPFTEADEPRPMDAYALSKWRAEQAVWDVARRDDLGVTVIRPPLVYGPGNPGNFFRLLKLLDSGWPIPLGGIRNSRSMIYVDNLVDMVATCIRRPAATGNVFVVSDGEDISTPNLIVHMSKALGKSPRMFALPKKVLRGLAALVGRTGEIEKLSASLIIDISKVQAVLDWKPPVRLEQGLWSTVDWYRSLVHPA
jgi:nucleoside-diphosphate-sugar epimerase